MMPWRMGKDSQVRPRSKLILIQEGTDDPFGYLEIDKVG